MKSQGKASDIDVAADHDCFTILMIEADKNRFLQEREGGPFVAAGETDIGAEFRLTPTRTFYP